MVREFTLVDGSGEEYSLTNEEHLLYNPSGLGFEYENTYRQVGHRFILANSVQKQSVISGTVHFSAPDAYYDYQEFIEFCGRDGLKMEYRLSEMPSRKIKCLTGTVYWSQINNGIYAGSYDFITGNYIFTECLFIVNNDTIVTEETELLQSFLYYAEFPPALRLFSINIPSVRSELYPVYCNGLPVRNWDMDDLSTTFKEEDKYASGVTYVGGNTNKIYFVVMLDALIGKNAKQWLIDNNTVFSYTLDAPISGVNTDYKFSPKLMYNPTVEFIGKKGNTKISSTGYIVYENSQGNIIEKNGNKINLEDTVIGQELNALVVNRDILNKSNTSRFLFVDSDLVSNENRNAWATGSSITYSGTTSASHRYSNLPVFYATAGRYRFTGKINILMSYNTQTVTAGYGISNAKASVRVVGATTSSIGYIPLLTDISSNNTEKVWHDVNSSGGSSLSGARIHYSFDEIINIGIDPEPYDPYDTTIAFTINVRPYPTKPDGSNWAYNIVGCHILEVSIEDLHVYNADTSQEVANISDLSFDGDSLEVSVYQADSQHYQRAVRLNKVEKTELTKFSSLETKVEFECLEPWGDPFTSFVEHGTSPDPVNSITFDTDCHALSPCDLYISGPCTNPTWTQTVNGVEVTTGGYTGTIAAGEQLLIRAKDGACGIYLINGSGNTDDVYKYSDFSKDRFVFIRYGENVITVTDGTDPATQIDCYIEGELYYESV